MCSLLRWRRRAAGALVFSCLVVAVACGPPPPSTTTDQPGQAPEDQVDGSLLGSADVTLRIGLQEDLTNWDPGASWWTPSQLQLGRSVYDRLAVYDAGQRLQPELATSIESDEAGTRWVIQLREGLTFHDGSPLDSAAVAANLEARRVGPATAALFEPVASVFAQGPSTVAVEMLRPWATFPHVLAAQPGFIASPATLTSSAVPVGTGAFRFVASSPGSFVALSRNDDHWKGPAVPAHVEAVVMTSDLVRAEALRVGDLDLALLDEPRAIGAVEPGWGEVVLDREMEAPKLTVVLNAASAPFVDAQARQALDLATDREAIWESDPTGSARRAHSPAADESVWFQGDAVPIRQVGAAAALASAHEDRYGSPLAFALLVPDEPWAIELAQLWAAQQGEAGIRVDLQILPLAEVRRQVGLGQHVAAVLPLFGSWHPDLWYPALHRADLTAVGVEGRNAARFGSADIDEALDAARSSDELAVQVDQYKTVQTALNESDLYIWLVRLAHAVVLSPTVEGRDGWKIAEGAAGLASEGGTIALEPLDPG